MIEKRQTILTMRSYPTGPLEIGFDAVHTWHLVKVRNEYQILISQSQVSKRKRTIINIEHDTAEQWLRELKEIRVPLMPSPSSTCDGSYYKFIFRNNGTSIELCWHNIAPDGAERLDAFKDFLWSFVPEEWDDEPVETDPNGLNMVI